VNGYARELGPQRDIFQGYYLNLARKLGIV
jgi:hypothetical protein